MLNFLRSRKAEENLISIDPLFDELATAVRTEFTQSYLLCSNQTGFDTLADTEKRAVILVDFLCRMDSLLDRMEGRDTQ